MRSDRHIGRWMVKSKAWQCGLAIIGWLVLIAFLHYWLNYRQDVRATIRMGYMPVVTNLAAPLLDLTSAHTGDYRFKAIKFASFAEMAEALRNGHIEAAFMIAPLAIVLKQQETDVRIVYIVNRHESTLVVRKALKVRSILDLAGKTLAVPMRYSGHHLAVLDMLKGTPVEGRVKIVEMNPPDMASALAAGSLDAYFVGEPFAAQTLLSGDAEVLHYVEEIWPHFICNLVLVKQDLIERNPEAVRQMVAGAARSGMWAHQYPQKAATIASHYWNQPREVIAFALTTPEARIEYDRFTPRVSEIQELADKMHRYNLIPNTDITTLVDDRFARQVDLNGVTDLESILPP
ncbi:MAG: ABC transporter substrate-binding protein [Desulfosarcina sp.]|nr:ABC transporter substrate-binding protein [Desulfobacterales bacterium]